MLSQEKLNAMKILKKQYDELSKDCIDNIGVTVGLVDENNLFQWKCTLSGPKKTSYANGIFLLRINFPDNFPNSPPEVYFITPIYHINVNPCKLNMRGAEELGHVCISTLNHWKPETPIREILKSIFALFFQPNPESPYGFKRADEYLYNRPLYEKKIKHFTKLYAYPDKPHIEYNTNWDFNFQ